MSRMSSSSFLNSFQVRKQQILVFNANSFLVTFKRRCFSGYQAKWKFWVMRIQEKQKKLLITFR